MKTTSNRTCLKDTHSHGVSPIDYLLSGLAIGKQSTSLFITDISHIRTISDERIPTLLGCFLYSAVDPNSVQPTGQVHQCIGPLDTSLPIKSVLHQLRADFPNWINKTSHYTRRQASFVRSKLMHAFTRAVSPYPLGDKPRSRTATECMQLLDQSSLSLEVRAVLSVLCG